MTEELTGTDFVEANHGLKPAPTEPTHAEPKTYSGDRGLIDAANDLTAERGTTSEQEPIERHLEWKTGHRAGERVDMKAERFSLSAEQAAKTLSEVHRNEDARDLNPLLNDLALEVDLARAQASGRPDPVQEAPADNQLSPEQPDSPQPDAAPESPPSGLSPKLQAALQDPELRAAFEAPYQQAAQVQQAYNGAVQQVAEVALSSVLANFPELAGYNAQQLPTVLAHIQRSDPVKAQAIQNQLQQVERVYSAAQQAKAVEAQQRQEQFKQWSKAEDDRLLAKIPELATDTDMRVSKAAVKALNDVGYSNEELAAAWNGVPFSMRDHRAQLLIWKAAQYDMARAGVGRPEPKPLPGVLRPGIAPSVGERNVVDTSDLRKQLKSARGLEAVRIATKIHQAQRRSRD